MRGEVVLGNGFEITEALTTINILKRAAIQVDSASANPDLEVISSNQTKVIAERLLKDITEKEYDFLVIPGGKAVFSVWDHNERIHSLIRQFHQKNKYIFAICAAPYLLAKNGLLKELPYTCFPGCDQGWEGKQKKKDGVVVTPNIITAKAMYYTIDFALAIVEKLSGTKKKEEILASVKGVK